VYLFGVKYRPERQYDEFLAAQIQIKGQPPQSLRSRRLPR
jgi:hypothetical protein